MDNQLNNNDVFEIQRVDSMLFKQKFQWIENMHCSKCYFASSNSRSCCRVAMQAGELPYCMFFDKNNKLHIGAYQNI